MAHREGIREFLKDVQVHGLVYDWGCGTKPIKKHIAYAEGTEFIGIDKLDHVGADVVADIEAPELKVYLKGDEEKKRRCSEFAFCLEVIEHVWYSKQLIQNIYDNLKSGGVLYLSQPFLYEVHKEDDRKRFTHHGLEQLLKEVGFWGIIIDKTGGEDMDHAWGYVVRAVK